MPHLRRAGHPTCEAGLGRPECEATPGASRFCGYEAPGQVHLASPGEIQNTVLVHFNRLPDQRGSRSSGASERCDSIANGATDDGRADGGAVLRADAAAGAGPSAAPSTPARRPALPSRPRHNLLSRPRDPRRRLSPSIADDASPSRPRTTRPVAHGALADAAANPGVDAHRLSPRPRRRRPRRPAPTAPCVSADRGRQLAAPRQDAFPRRRTAGRWRRDGRRYHLLIMTGGGTLCFEMRISHAARSS